MRFHGRFISIFCALVFVTACGSRAPQSKSEPQHQADREKHWGYEETSETVGPEHWGSLAGDEACADGHEQSPIGICTSGDSAATPADLAALQFSYKPTQLKMLNNGHTIQMTCDSGSEATFAGGRYRLAQFHFHAPSEHALDGTYFPMELHLVHVDPSGTPIAVVGIWINEGKSNPALQEAFLHLPQTAGGTSEPAGMSINPSALLPRDRSYFTYPGSLTTPPCSEGVRWFVLRSPIEMSKEQIDAFRALPGLAQTHRPIQSRGARTVQVCRTAAEVKREVIYDGGVP